MRFLTRRRAIAAGVVAAFVAAILAIGAVSRSSPDSTTTSGSAAGSPGTAPSATWYWTMAVAPSDPNVLVLGTSGGLYRSTDGGRTWQPTGPKHLNATSVVQSGSSLFAGGDPTTAVASPVIRKGAIRTASDGAAMLAVSVDGGRTWRALHPRGLPKVAVQALTVDPGDTTVLYALLNNGKLYRSTDGARSFALVSSKLGVPPWALVMTQGHHFLAGDMDTGNYVSANGKTWQRTSFSDTSGGKMVMEYAVQPKDTTKVLMSAFGIELSTDGGKTWHVTLKTSVMFGPIAYSSSSSDVAYAVGFDGSVWRSDDGGNSWSEVSA